MTEGGRDPPLEKVLVRPNTDTCRRCGKCQRGMGYGVADEYGAAGRKSQFTRQAAVVRSVFEIISAEASERNAKRNRKRACPSHHIGKLVPHLLL